jgi:tetratricopeptide (TPR) repeat protein
MGFFDWLLGRKPTRREPENPACGPAAEDLPSFPMPGTPGRSKPPRPKDVRPVGEGSPLVAFTSGKALVLMDVDAFEYTYGDADGPDPAQRDLDEVMEKVTRVFVLEGAMLRGRAMGGPILVDSHDAGAIRELAACLWIVEDPSTFGHCGCLGGPTIELYAGPEHLATIGLQHGHAIRWERWHHDARLQSGECLTRWLHGRGVDPARLEAIYHRGNNFLFGEPDDPSGRRDDVRKLCLQAQEEAGAERLDEAATLCTRAIGLDPDQAEPYALRGEIRRQQGRIVEAGQDCSAAIDRGLRHPGIYHIRAIARDQAGELEEAAADCSMALHLDPGLAAGYNSRGLILVQLDRHDEALADFDEAIRLAPAWALPHLHRAGLRRSLGQLEPALDDYDRAVELAKGASPEAAHAEENPMLALAYCHRGDARFDGFLEEEAEADFAEARGIHPPTAAAFLSDMWMRRGLFARAVGEFTALVELHPEDARGYIGRGQAREQLGDLEEADGDYSEAIRLQPEGGLGLVLRASIRHRQGRIDDALADLSEHLRQHPDDWMALLFRASLHRERKDWGAAADDLNAAHRAAPESPPVCNNLAWMLATCPEAGFRDGPRAVSLARRACEATDWKHPYYLGTLGAALAEVGDFDEAARWQSEALALYPAEEKPAGEARLELYRAGQPYREWPALR